MYHLTFNFYVKYVDDPSLLSEESLGFPKILELRRLFEEFLLLVIFSIAEMEDNAFLNFEHLSGNKVHTLQRKTF